MNTLIVDLPISFDMCKVENAKIIYDLFSGLVNVFRPFWGCVSDNILSKRYRPFLKNNKPTSIHWINYLSEEVCNRIGKEGIARLLDEVNTMTFNSGILMARNRAFDINNPEDVLHFEEMQKKYLKSEG